MSTLTIAMLLAIAAGLAASALHALLYRRREQRLVLLAAAVAKHPSGAILSDIAAELNLSAYRCGTVYADLNLLERRGIVTHRWDDERGRLAWTATGRAA